MLSKYFHFPEIHIPLQLLIFNVLPFWSLFFHNSSHAHLLIQGSVFSSITVILTFRSMNVFTE